MNTVTNNRIGSENTADFDHPNSTNRDEKPSCATDFLLKTDLKTEQPLDGNEHADTQDKKRIKLETLDPESYLSEQSQAQRLEIKEETIPCKTDDDKDISALQPSLQTRAYKCSFCTYEAKTVYNLISHTLVHKINSQVLDRMHQSGHTPVSQRFINNEVDKYKCKVCQHKAKSRLNLVEHMQKHQLYKCTECEHLTYNTNNMRKHMAHHFPHKVYKCEECSYKSNHSVNLKRHLLVHKNFEIGASKSEQCDDDTKSWKQE